MANEFLNSPVIPGVPLTKDDHKQMKVLLGVVVIILIFIGLGLYYWSSNSAPTTETPALSQQELQRQAIISQLKNVPPPTAAQVTAITQQLKRSKTTVTDIQRAAILKQLQDSK